MTWIKLKIHTGDILQVEQIKTYAKTHTHTHMHTLIHSLTADEEDWRHYHSIPVTLKNLQFCFYRSTVLVLWPTMHCTLSLLPVPRSQIASIILTRNNFQILWTRNQWSFNDNSPLHTCKGHNCTTGLISSIITWGYKRIWIDFFASLQIDVNSHYCATWLQ